MDAVVIYEATVLVYWAVAFIPYALREGGRHLILLSAMPLFAIDMYLGSALHTLGKNILTSIFVISLAFTGGLVQHYYNRKQESHDAGTNRSGNK